MMINARHRSSPFTASQWQELQHQALIFKHMVSGMPIPSDLLYPMRRGLDSSSLATPTLFPPPRPFGWGSCFQIGYGRKADPEPGRCRRTDGKKWRCSKEAFQDSKYCEKHMHRGRNRSRKPVEMTRATAAKTTNSASAIPPPNTAKPSATPSLSSPSSSSIPAENHHSFHFPHSLSSRPPGLGFSSQNNTPHFNLETGSGSYSSDYRNYRYLHGLKEDVDEHAFFSEASGTLRGSVESPFDSSWQSKPMKTSSFAELKNKNCSASVFPNNYSQLQLHNNFTDEPKQQQQEQHCLVLGTDFKSGRRMKAEQEDEPQQRLRCFFDEWPLKGRDSWLDSEDNRSNRASFSSTQLSISLPMASEFPASNSKSCYDD